MLMKKNRISNTEINLFEKYQSSLLEKIKMRSSINIFRISLLLICMLMISASCNRKYRGMNREDREKMKIVERFHKGQARGGCPADRARIAKEKEEQKLAKKSRQKAAKK
jgi:hypothetical protein